MALKNKKAVQNKGNDNAVEFSSPSRVESKMVQQGDQKGTRQFGLISGGALVIGSCVGIGIFFKSGSVLTSAGTGWLTIIAWLIGGLSSIVIAMSFSEISSIRLADNKGLASWTSAFLGRTTGRIVAWMHATFYFPVVVISIAYYVIDAFFGMVISNFGGGGATRDLQAWENVLLIFVILAFVAYFVFMNSRFTMHSKIVQVGGTFTKYLPILLFIVAGLFVVPFIRGGSFFDGFSYQPEIKGEKVDPTFSGLMLSLAPVLFGYDSFLNVGNITENIKNPRRNIALAIVGGMIVVTVTYILLTWGLMNVDANPPAGREVEPGNSLSAAELIFDSAAWKNVVNVFILISGTVVLNALVTSSIRLGHSLVISREVVGHQLLGKPGIVKRGYLSGGILIFSIVLFWYLVLLIAGGFDLSTDSATRSGSLINEFSNVPVIFFFIVYVLIIIGALENRFSNRVKVNKKPWMMYTGVASIVLVFFIVGYYFYLIFSGSTLAPTDNGEAPTNILAVLCLIAFVWIGFGFINIYFCPTKKEDKRLKR